jgi:hypothetical protein
MPATASLQPEYAERSVKGAEYKVCDFLFYERHDFYGRTSLWGGEFIQFSFSADPRQKTGRRFLHDGQCAGKCMVG